jgi:hypothetical protein
MVNTRQHAPENAGAQCRSQHEKPPWRVWQNGQSFAAALIVSAQSGQTFVSAGSLMD